jgi:hypothetical protein
MPATLLIKPWHDPVVDTLGHDPRSRYVEQFWLPTLGPTALLLLRHLADRFDRDPDGVELTVIDTSHALGLGQREGSASPIVRTLRRLSQFDLACEDPMSNTVAVRRNVPPVNTRHLRRLPRDLQRAHAEWAEQQLAEAPMAEARRRARRVAFTLLEQGDDPDHVERALHAIGFHPALCHESAQWAYQRHREALDHVHEVQLGGLAS